MIDFSQLLIIEFAYNNSYHSSIQMDPYKALDGRRCRSPVGLFEVGETTLIEPNSVLYAIEKVQLIRDRLKIAQSHQKILCRCKDKETRVPS